MTGVEERGRGEVGGKKGWASGIGSTEVHL